LHPPAHTPTGEPRPAAVRTPPSTTILFGPWFMNHAACYPVCPSPMIVRSLHISTCATDSAFARLIRPTPFASHRPPTAWDCQTRTLSMSSELCPPWAYFFGFVRVLPVAHAPANRQLCRRHQRCELTDPFRKDQSSRFRWCSRRSERLTEPRKQA